MILQPPAKEDFDFQADIEVDVENKGFSPAEMQTLMLITLMAISQGVAAQNRCFSRSRTMDRARSFGMPGNMRK